MNELKLMAIKAKNRLLNKSLRAIYSNTISKEKEESKQNFSYKEAVNMGNETERKKYLLDRIKNR